MAKYLNVEEFLEKAAQGLPIIDVRSPAEYEQAHIPSAYTLPIFDNEERAVVGTMYKKVGRIQAVQKGLELVGTKLKNFTKFALKLKSEEILVHCWRGGMRSASMAWLFETVGLKTYVLTDGYKAYRNHVLNYFDKEYKIMLLGGCTGGGKTEILQLLKEAGEQVIDLEGLANHKGSAFGSIGHAPQPSSEYFEHLIYNELVQFDPNKVIWLEDESRNIGKNFIPQGFWKTMREAPLVEIDTSYDIRLERIMRDYACFNAEELAVSILKIEKRLGFDKCKKAQEACLNGDVTFAAKICLDYYDKLYGSSLENRFPKGSTNYFKLSIDNLELDHVVPNLLKIIEEYNVSSQK